LKLLSEHEDQILIGHSNESLRVTFSRNVHGTPYSSMASMSSATLFGHALECGFRVLCS
jgi:hypothetical protein